MLDCSSLLHILNIFGVLSARYDKNLKKLEFHKRYCIANFLFIVLLYSVRVWILSTSWSDGITRVDTDVISANYTLFSTIILTVFIFAYAVTRIACIYLMFLKRLEVLEFLNLCVKSLLDSHQSQEFMRKGLKIFSVYFASNFVHGSLEYIINYKLGFRSCLIFLINHFEVYSMLWFKFFFGMILIFIHHQLEYINETLPRNFNLEINLSAELVKTMEHFLNIRAIIEKFHKTFGSIFKIIFVFETVMATLRVRLEVILF